MGKIVQLVVLLLLGYLVVAFGIPWVLEQIDEVDKSAITRRPEFSGEGEAAGCVYMAQQANLYFAREARTHTQSGGDAVAWREASESFLSRLHEAELECVCPEPGCDLARRALDLLEDQVEAVDSVIRGDGRYAGSMARDQERIVDLLDEASALVR